MVKENKYMCEYTSSFECPMWASHESLIETLFGGEPPCDSCIVMDAFETGIREEICDRERMEDELRSLKNELKRTDITDDERSKILKKITDHIRGMI